MIYDVEGFYMSQFTIVSSTDELLNEINNKKEQGYESYELRVVSKHKLHMDELTDSEISITVTSGTFSDTVSRVLTGEDAEEAIFCQYDLEDEEKEQYKQAILNGNYVLISGRDDSSHDEVEHVNAAYDEDTISYDQPEDHTARESKGPKS